MSGAIFFTVMCFIGGGDTADSANPVVREVIYKNAHHIPKKELDDLSGIRGKSLDLAANQAACVKIQDHLKNKGRFWATVSLEKGNLASDDQVIFIVSEGPIVRVRSTKFVGNEVQTTQCLQQMIAPLENSRPFSGVFHAGSVADGVKVLEDYYQSIGYRDVKASRELKFSDDHGSVEIVYTIAEGPRCCVKEDRFAPPPSNPTVPGLVRLSGKNEPSDFVTPVVATPGILRNLDPAGRTTVRFANPRSIKSQIYTMDPADAIRTNVMQETAPPKEPDARMFGAGIQCSCGIMGSIVMNDGMATMESYWGLTEPRPAGASYRLAHGQIYRVALADIEKPVTIGVSGTLEVMRQDSKSEQYLSRNTISIAFTDEDFKNVMEAKTVIKIFYLPHALPREDDGDASGVQVSTYCGRAENGVDPVQETRQRGTVLLVMRMGIGQIFSASLGTEGHKEIFQFSIGGIFR